MRLGSAAVVTALVSALLLLPGSPAQASFGTPRPITPDGRPASAIDQATDLQGDTTYLFGIDGHVALRTRRADGTLTPIRIVTDPVYPSTVFRIAVDDDGDGVVIWDQSTGDGVTEYVLARRFSRGGGLGGVVRVTPRDHQVRSARVAVRPHGAAVITWGRLYGSSYQPYVRTLNAAGRLGPVLRAGPGPDVEAPLIAMQRSGRATLVWTNTNVMARDLRADGTLSPLRTIRRPAYSGEDLSVDEIGINARGIIHVACTKWARMQGMIPYQYTYDRACWFRISPTLRLIGRAVTISPSNVSVGRVRLGVAPGGQAVVGWQAGYYAGAWVRRITPGGSLGSPRWLSGGGLGEIALRSNGDGVIGSSARNGAGLRRIIRATLVRDGAIGSTVRVGTNDYDTVYLRAGVTPTGRRLVTWAGQLEQARIWTIAGN